MGFNIGDVHGLELILELIFHERADEYLLVTLVGVEALGVGEELVGEGKEPTFFDVGCEF